MSTPGRFPLALVAGVVLLLVNGCKSKPAVVDLAVPAQTSAPAETFPPRPGVKPPTFKVFDERESIFTLVTKPDATDDEVESVV